MVGMVGMVGMVREGRKRIVQPWVISAISLLLLLRYALQPMSVDAVWA